MTIATRAGAVRAPGPLLGFLIGARADNRKAPPFPFGATAAGMIFLLGLLGAPAPVAGRRAETVGRRGAYLPGLARRSWGRGGTTAVLRAAAALAPAGPASTPTPGRALGRPSRSPA